MHFASRLAQLDTAAPRSVTRAEFDALAARVDALEAALRNAVTPVTPAPVTRNADRDVTRNASNAERQRRYRERKRASA